MKNKEIATLLLLVIFLSVFMVRCSKSNAASSSQFIKDTIFFNGDPSRGDTNVWKDINIQGTGFVKSVFAENGNEVWEMHKPYGSHRSEGHGAKNYQAQEGDDIYIGWLSKFSMPLDSRANTFAIFQWKSYPTEGSLQNHPIMLRTTNGNLVLNDYLVGDIERKDWSTPLDTSKWLKFVLHLKVSRNPGVGFMELYYNDVLQKLNNDSTRIYCRTLDVGFNLLGIIPRSSASTFL